MNITALKTGMVVVTNNKHSYLVFIDAQFGEETEENDIFVSKSGWNRVNDYTVFLQEKYGDTPYDIFQIYKPKNPYAITQFLKNEDLSGYTLIWER
jgi:hypothetical protein